MAKAISVSSFESTMDGMRMHVQFVISPCVKIVVVGRSAWTTASCSVTASSVDAAVLSSVVLRARVEAGIVKINQQSGKGCDAIEPPARATSSNRCGHTRVHCTPAGRAVQYIGYVQPECQCRGAPCGALPHWHSGT